MKLGWSGMCDRFGTDMSYSLSISVFISLVHLPATSLLCTQIHTHLLLNKRSKGGEAVVNQFSSPLCLSPSLPSLSLSKVVCISLLGSVCEQPSPMTQNVYYKAFSPM